jgi:hypothetical protein
MRSRQEQQIATLLQDMRDAARRPLATEIVAMESHTLQMERIKAAKANTPVEPIQSTTHKVNPSRTWVQVRISTLLM